MERVNESISDKIKKSAETLIFSYGIRGWNMDEFANEAGITKRTLYKYVDSKEKLVEDTLIEYITGIQRELADNLKGIKNFKEGIERIIDIYPSMIIKMDSRVVRDIFNKYPSIEEAVVRQKESFTKEILFFIKEGQKNGLVDARYDCETILEVIQSVIIYYIKTKPDKFEEKLRESISMTAYGFMKKGGNG